MSTSGMKEAFRKEEGAFTFKIAAPFTTRPHLPVPIERVGLTDGSVLSWTQSTTTGENTRAAKAHELHIHTREKHSYRFKVPETYWHLWVHEEPWNRFFVG